ncbi:uncharacterized protein KGF55_003182 [Candida pseudojiufengensis]|uniref:uncharacterized protein n=1 Tax=Candida pseudojiufengensis TaxID=497109 RepID=UPI002225A200|nr:uncharacterized protein KGF55_003182 [Candida pseudojiufengensis]KAI5962106.1 hypothetical protein KGF55_003182 [Candida pseudojiufengensis]
MSIWSVIETISTVIITFFTILYFICSFEEYLERKERLSQKPPPSYTPRIDPKQNNVITHDGRIYGSSTNYLVAGSGNNTYFLSGQTSFNHRSNGGSNEINSSPIDEDNLTKRSKIKRKIYSKWNRLFRREKYEVLGAANIEEIHNSNLDLGSNFGLPPPYSVYNVKDEIVAGSSS